MEPPPSGGGFVVVRRRGAVAAWHCGAVSGDFDFIRCRLKIIGEAAHEALWELTGSDVSLAEVKASIGLMGPATDEESLRILRNVFWSGTVLDFNVHAPIPNADELDAFELEEERWDAWGSLTQPLGAYVRDEVESEGFVSLVWLLRYGLAFEWFWAVCEARKDVELIYEVGVPSDNDQGEPYLALYVWHRPPGSRVLRLVGAKPPDDLWKAWSLEKEVVVRPAEP